MRITTERGARTRAAQIKAEIEALDREIASESNPAIIASRKARKYNRECALFDVLHECKKYGWSVE